jgi:hypothetical protein
MLQDKLNFSFDVSQVYTVDFSVRFKTLMLQTTVKISRLLCAILLS